MWDLHSLTGVEPTPRALEGEVLPTGLPFFMASSTASERPRASQRAMRCARQKTRQPLAHAELKPLDQSLCQALEGIFYTNNHGEFN